MPALVKRRVRRLAAVLSCALAMLAGLPGPARAAAPAPEPKVLNIYNWSDYIAPDTIANFEKETGIKVRYDSFDNNEVVYAKLVAGGTGYDIVVPSSNWAKLLIDGGLLRKLDKSQIPNLKNLDPAIEAALSKVDPGNQYLVDWLWGYTTVGINVGKVKAALGDLPMPANAWDLVFKPEYMRRLTRCGVSFLDSATEVLPVALHYLGRPAYSRNPADYAAAGALLKAVRPYVTLFSSAGYINEVADGSVCVVLGWTGDINIAQRRAQQAHTGQDIRALIPDDGGLLFFDTMAIPADAPHPGNAQRWINYILQPQVHAALTNHVFYANPNLASRPYIRPEVATNPSIFLTPAQLARMVPPDALTNDRRRLMTRTFTSFKSGF